MATTPSGGLRSRKVAADEGHASQSATSTQSKRRRRRKIDPMTLLLSLLTLPLLAFVLAASSPHDKKPDRIAELPDRPSSVPDHKTSKPSERPTASEPPPAVNLAKNQQLLHRERPILTAFLEDTSKTLKSDVKPLPPRTTTARDLNQTQFPRVSCGSKMFETWPIDDYPLTDPYLPWIHDVFPSSDGSQIHFVAQNRRRCGTGQDMEGEMEFWEPQMALFQPVPIVKEEGDGKTRLASSHDEATTKETRFICRFQNILNDDQEYETMSEYSFNYEYVSWRKGKDSMYAKEGKDNVQFWLSQLLFKCPVPTELQHLIQTQQHIKDDLSLIYLDLIPIRTPPRYNSNPLFSVDHVGQDFTSRLFDLNTEFGSEHYLPAPQDSGRWANIPICESPERKQHRLVACTWTASSYTRRGDVVGISDTEARVREWIVFHKMVGFDHVYIYDNTAPGLPSALKQISDEFPDFVDYHRWPCTICNNNRPSHKNPGERSSQYAAEASCRERYGPSTDWMAFIDTDEYLIPVGDADTWEPLLDKSDEEGTHILKMRSSRAKPRIEHLVPMADQSLCVDPSKGKKPPGGPQPCLEPVKNATFLQIYNCEYIRPPRPERFERAMKQIYRPDFVQSHFVHYSTVTKDISRYRRDFGPDETFIRKVHGKNWEKGSPEVFLDEVNQGLLVHTRSVLPHESQYREQGCKNGSKYGCAMGMVCPDSTPFVDELHQLNVFADEESNYCNCWKNNKVEDVYIPKLTALLKQHKLQVEHKRRA